MDYMKKLVNYAVELTYNKLPSKVIETTKLFIADYYAACFAGYKVNTMFNKAVLETIKEFGGQEQATVLYEEKKYPVHEAAFMNAIYAHGADLDDGNKISAGHIGASVISSVFALAEWMQYSWDNVIVAINVGYDFFNKIAGAAQPGLYEKGFHSTGVAGGIASAAACAKLLDLDIEAFYNAVSIAAVQSSGLIIIDESGQGCKPINPGNAARIGVFSAVLASKKINSPKNILQSKKGWFNAYAENNNMIMKVDDLGKNFTIMDSYLKLYPSCRHTHSCIDAILELRSNMGEEQFENIKYIKIFIYPSAIKSAGKIVQPQNAEEAKFSITYAVATALYKGEFTIDDLYIDNLSTSILEAIKKVELISDESMEDREKGIRGCKVEIGFYNNKIVNQQIRNPKGEGNNPLSWSDILRKMTQCINEFENSKDANRIVEECISMERFDEFKNYFQIVNNSWKCK